MIIAIEGASAAGKTTWCRSHCPDGLVEAAPQDVAAPDLFADPHEVANFWVNFATQLWQAALHVENQLGVAFCDGDPFHLYYSWALWKSGALNGALFKIESKLYRQAIADARLGFADLVCWLHVPPSELRRRALADLTRRHKRHEMNLGCVPWMRSWFAARKAILPGTVLELTGNFRPQDLPAISAMPERYNPAVMDQIIDSLQQLDPFEGLQSA